MMESIFQKIKEVNESTYLSIAPADCKPPFCVFSLVSEVLPDLISSYSYSEKSYQVDVYSSSAKEAREFKQKIIKTIDGLSASFISCSFSYENETQFFRFLIEFKIIQGES